MTVDLDSQRTVAPLPDPKTDLGTSRYPSVISRFAVQARTDPQRIAISWDGHEYTYRETFDWIASLTPRVQPGQRVALYGRRSPGTVAALMAVVAAGGVVVPIDESLPRHRRQAMVREANANLLIAIGQLDLGWVGGPIEVVQVSPSEPTRLRGSGLPDRGNDSDAAYIFFTSGSTGIPKGVLGTKASLDHFSDWMANTFDIGPGDRVSLLRSLSFDAVLREILVPLAVGATLCIAPDPLDPDRALPWIANEGITVLNATPSHAAVWLGASHQTLNSSLRWVMFSGEVLNDGLVRRWRSRMDPPGRVVNMYGPTETTMIRTYQILGDDLESGVQPVGRAISHSQALVVDSKGRLCDVNHPGEVWLRTSFGTHGYINDLDAQARAFVVNPFTDDSNDLIYRSGDIGWYRPDGALVVSGRIDDQVQILGVRIEPGEVAAHLSVHPQVVAAAVLAEPGRDDQPSLVAYLVPVDPNLTDALLREYLADRVPGVAVPARFVFLAEMPLNENGKVDRERLRSAPRSSPPSESVESADVSRLAALSPAKRRLLELRLSRSGRPIKPDDASSDEETGTPLSFAQERLWFLDRMYPGQSTYNIPRAFRLSGPLDLDRLRTALDSIQARHEILRTRYLSRDGVPYQRIDPIGAAPFQVVDLRIVKQEEREAGAARLVEAEVQAPFDLATGPIWRITVVALTATEHLLIIVFHHIATDGWSLPILFDEMAIGYREGHIARPILQYADYARRQRQQLTLGAYEEDLEYWATNLSGAPSLLSLPSDRPRLPVRNWKGSRHRFSIPTARTEQVESLVRSHRVTPFMVGLALFAGFLHRITGTPDLVVGVPSADRPSTDFEALIGFFVNSLPMRSRLVDGASYRQLLEQIRNTAVSAYNHRGVPFEHIVSRLQPRRSPDHTPIFQVFFQFGGAFDGTLELEGLEIESVARPRTMTKFDLTMYLGMGDGVLGGSLVYARELFDQATIELVADGFGAFASAALADPDLSISMLPVADAPFLPAASSESREDRSLTLLRPETKTAAAARWPTIERMCEIWHHLLGGPPVLPDDDFFARGGHSLLAVRIFSRIESEWGIELPIGALFEATTPRLLAAQVDAIRRPDALIPRRGLRRAPLSFAQRRLWFLDRLSPGSSSYHLPWRIGLEGDLDLEALQASFNTLCQRHAVLRTRIVEEDGVPWQIVDEPFPISIEHHDLTDLDGEERHQRLTELLVEHNRRPFDLASDPMMRVMLVGVEKQRYALSVVTHHVAVDADSMRIIRRELRTVYNAYRSGEPIDRILATLPVLPLDYADVAAWQAELFADRGEPGLVYWQERLKGDLPVLDLVTDTVRPLHFNHRGAALTVAVPDDVTEELLRLGRDLAATPVMTLLSAFAVLLRRHTRQDDIIVGIPSTERVLPGTEDLIGFLVNSLPIRIDLSREPSFEDLLRQVRQLVIEALEHGQVPFEAIVERVDPPRDPGRTPIYQAMFDVAHGGNAQGGAGWLGFDGLKVSRSGVRAPDRVVKFDLRLHCSLRDSSLKATFEFRTDLFDRSTIEAFAAQFVRLLESITHQSDLPVDRLDIRPPAEEPAVVVTDADDVHPYPSDSSVFDRFTEVVARNPNQVAIETANRRYTYQQTAQQVYEFAARLKEAGVRSGDAVGVLVPRSSGTVVAMLAILSLGASYVPLDASYPPDRVRAIVAEAGMSVMIGGKGSPERLTVDYVGERGSAPAELVDSGVAYTMYTSGSTGRPKGVIIPHRAILRLVCNTNYVTIGTGDAVAFASNVAFDATTFEVWGALLNGARLVIVEPATLLSPPALASFLKERAVSTMFVTTALFNTVVAEKPDAFATVRDLLFGGEVVDPSTVRQCLEAGPPKRLLHVYGPTESTTFASFHEVKAVSEAARTVPIGRPLANTTLRVVDGHMVTVPTAVPGELLIGGDGLGLGYLGDPNLTADRFISIGVDRMYRTGDLVRKMPDGSIEFLGRLDRQIKLRGYRIEPAEIEARLADHPQVAEALVVPRGENGQIRLAAYVVPRADSSLDASDVLAHLRRAVPEFMVPSSIQLIGNIPLTTNGKVNEAALPAPRWLSSIATSPRPLNDGEKRMASIWQSVLGARQVKPDDNFFDLGGHSLQAVKVFAGIEREFGIRPPLAMLFEAPTVASLTRRVIDYISLPDPPSELVAIRPEGDLLPLFCIHPAGGNALAYAPLARHLRGDQPLFGIQAVGVDGVRRPQRTIGEMAAHYEELIRATCANGPYLLAGWSSGGVIAYEIARRMTEAGDGVALLALLDTSFPMSRQGASKLRMYRRLLRRPQGVAAVARLLYLETRHVLGTVRHGVPLAFHKWRGAPPPLRHIGWRLWRKDRLAVADYTPQPFAGKITFFRAVGGARPRSRLGDRWRQVAAEVEIIEVAGTHTGKAALVNEPNVADLAARLQEVLDSVHSGIAR